MKKVILVLLLSLSFSTHAKDGGNIDGVWRETTGDGYLKIVQKGVEFEFFDDDILFLKTNATVTSSTHSMSSIARWGVDGSLIVHANILGKDFKESQSRIIIVKLTAPDKLQIEETQIYYSDDDLTPDIKSWKDVYHFTRVTR